MSLSAKRIEKNHPGASKKLYRKIQKDLGMYPWMKSRKAGRKSTNLRSARILKKSRGLW